MRIEQILGFSAHADKNDLRRWINHFKSPPQRVFLTHGEEKSILSLSEYIRSKDGWKVSAPKYQEEFQL
jgi:metallo-beta-lactamase family protein